MSGQEEQPPIQQTAETVVYRDRFITVYNDPVVFKDDDRPGTYLRIVESDGDPGVAMLPLAGSRVALVRTYRYALGTWEWGIPRGFAHGSDPVESARAELTEEIGSEPAELVPLGRMSPNSGLLASVVHLYIARYPAPVPSQAADALEVAEIRWIGLDELRSRIASGDIIDGFTLAAVTVAQCRSFL